MLSGRLFSMRYREELAVLFLQNTRFGIRYARLFREQARLFPALWMRPCGILFGFQEKIFFQAGEISILRKIQSECLLCLPYREPAAAVLPHYGRQRLFLLFFREILQNVAHL